MNRAGLLIPAAVILLLLPGAEASRSLSFSNLGPLTAGLKSVMSVSVLSGAGVTDTNFFGQIRLSSSSPDTILSPSEILILKGRGEKSFSIKETGSVSDLTLTALDPDARFPAFSTNLPVLHVEDSYDRKTLLVNELMPHTDSDPLYEWMEFYNNSPDPITLTDLCIYVYDQRSTSTTYFFRIEPGSVFLPPGPLSLPAGGYLLLVRSLAHFRQRYPNTVLAVESGSGGYAKTRIVSSEFLLTTKHQLSSTGSTVYIASNNSLTAPLLSLFCYGSWGLTRNAVLSRISPNLPVQDRNNWAIRSDGGTPGLPNAMPSSPSPAASEGLSLSPSVLAKTGDILSLRFESPEDILSARLVILNSAGRTARVLAEDLSLSHGEILSSSFDGRDNSNIPLGRGLYLAVLTGRDSRGRTLRFSSSFAVRGSAR